MTELKYTYTSVSDNGRASYGGNQTKSDSAVIKKCGCGIVAAADLIIYLTSGGKASSPVSLTQYNEFLRFLNRRYFPLIPKLGMNPIVLTAGLNLYFKNRKMEYSAMWQASGEKLFARIEQQLSDDIPVIMSVGQNFPCIWKKNKLDLYTKSGDTYIKTASAKAHYVTATGIDENYIRISSWGRELYIEKYEFMSYMKMYSAGVLCNMLKISRK